MCVPQIPPRDGFVYVTHEANDRVNVGSELYHRIILEERALPKHVPSPSNCSNLCLDSCKHHVRDGKCDELSGLCSRGTDCTDCGGERPACTASALPSTVPRAGAPEAEVCVATIMTADRVGSLHRLAASWPGMLSIAFLSAAFEHDVGLGVRLLHLDGRPPPLPARLALTVVRNEGYTSPHNRFPFNMLRNRAVAGCEAGAVLVVDVDFVLYAGRAGDSVQGALRREPSPSP